jgi:hypothetical protein
MSMSTCVRKHFICELQLKECISAQNVLHEIQCTSHHGPRHPFKDTGVTADSLTGIHSAIASVSSLPTQGYPTGKKPVDSSQVIVEAMQ